MTFAVWYLAIGWVFFVLWAAVEVHVVRAKRAQGVYASMGWRTYLLAPPVVVVAWPIFAVMIVRAMK